MSPEYALLNSCNSDWATLTAKEYDKFRMSPAYYDSIQEMKCNPSFPLVSNKDVKQCLQDVAAIHDSAECHKSLNKYELTEIEDQNHDLAYVSFNPSLMPTSPSISALACGRKLSSSICEVIESDSRSIHEVLGLTTDSSLEL